MGVASFVLAMTSWIISGIYSAMEDDITETGAVILLLFFVAAVVLAITFGVMCFKKKGVQQGLGITGFIIGVCIAVVVVFVIFMELV